MSRVAVLSDIHGNLPALKAVTRDAEARGCRDFINLGDLLSGPLWPAETADWLMSRGWRTIAGNHERQLLRLPPAKMGPSDAYAHEQLTAAHRDWIAALPATASFESLFLCHGTPASDVQPLLETIEPAGLRAASDDEVAERLGSRADMLTLCGHSHLPRLRCLPDGRRVVNPGSVGLQAFHDDQPYPYVVEVGDPRARYAVIDGDQVTFHAVDFNWHAAAAKAEQAGRGDWATALTEGRVTG